MSAENRALLRRLAEQAASHPRIEQAVLGAIRQELPGVIEQLLSAMYPGETVRFYARKRSGDRGERDRRIAAALVAGDPPALVAAREGLSLRQVQRIAAAAS